jgi:hypothetical protein
MCNEHLYVQDVGQKMVNLERFLNVEILCNIFYKTVYVLTKVNTMVINTEPSILAGQSL